MQSHQSSITFIIITIFPTYANTTHQIQSYTYPHMCKYSTQDTVLYISPHMRYNTLDTVLYNPHICDTTHQIQSNTHSHIYAIQHTRYYNSHAISQILQIYLLVCQDIGSCSTIHLYAVFGLSPL